ncbi:MAG: hypothetical protein LDL39_00380 [Magnetospirillum sp.]|nr:hypothetical protein [Magnetospirillum sp.]
MLRIEEIVGAMDDEFRYSLEALSDERLVQLLADKAALRRLRPVGVSNAEAQAMIVAIQNKRALPVPAKAAPRPRKPPRPKKDAVAAPECVSVATPECVAPPPTPTSPPSPTPALAPARLPPPADPLLLAPPASHGPAIRLGPPQQAKPAIEMGPPPPLPLPLMRSHVALASPAARRHALILGAVCLALAAYLALL